MSPHATARTRFASLLWVLTSLAALTAAGCATYTDHVQTAHGAASRGDYPAALDTVNRVLGADCHGELPGRWNENTGVALLERAVLLQAMGEFELSARDFRKADEVLEILDLSADPVGRIAKYVYSDSAEVYRVTPVEQLSLNPMNMMNYLAVGDLQSAAIEARRFTVIRNYLDQTQDLGDGRMGAYLAGFVFEQMGQYDRALRYYDEALSEGPLQSLREPVRRLAGRGSYRGRNISRYLDGVSGQAQDQSPGGEILVVVATGRVPYKVPERMPVGLAVGIAGSWITGDLWWLDRLGAKVVVYPKLVSPFGRQPRPMVHVDGREVSLELLSDQSARVRAEYERMKPQIIAASLTRLIARAAAAEGVRAGFRGSDRSVQVLGAWATELTLMALDRPDTRSWTFLPARVMVARVPVPPGERTVRVRLDDGREQTWHMTVSEDYPEVVVVTAP